MKEEAVTASSSAKNSSEVRQSSVRWACEGRDAAESRQSDYKQLLGRGPGCGAQRREGEQRRPCCSSKITAFFMRKDVSC